MERPIKGRSTSHSREATLRAIVPWGTDADIGATPSFETGGQSVTLAQIARNCVSTFSLFGSPVESVAVGSHQLRPRTPDRGATSEWINSTPHGAGKQRLVDGSNRPLVGDSGTTMGATSMETPAGKASGGAGWKFQWPFDVGPTKR